MARMNLTQNFKRDVEIGGTPAGFSARANTIGDLLVGEVGVFDLNGNKMTEALAVKGADFVIANRKSNGEILKSAVLNGDAIGGKATAKTYTASTVQVDYFGFNGTAGSIEELNDNVYVLNFRVIDLITGNHDGYYFKKVEYKTDLSATQEEIANGLAAVSYSDPKITG